MDPTTVILIVLISYVNAIFVLIGVVLGGFLVYRTKREPHEGLLKSPGEPGSSVVAEEGEAAKGEIPEQGVDDDEELGLGMDVMQQNQKFMEQFQKEHPRFVRKDQASSEEEQNGT